MICTVIITYKSISSYPIVVYTPRIGAFPTLLKSISASSQASISVSVGPFKQSQGFDAIWFAMHRLVETPETVMTFLISFDLDFCVHRGN